MQRNQVLNEKLLFCEPGESASDTASAILSCGAEGAKILARELEMVAKDLQFNPSENVRSEAQFLAVIASGAVTTVQDKEIVVGAGLIIQDALAATDVPGKFAPGPGKVQLVKMLANKTYSIDLAMASVEFVAFLRLADANGRPLAKTVFGTRQLVLSSVLTVMGRFALSWVR